MMSNKKNVCDHLFSRVLETSNYRQLKCIIITLSPIEQNCPKCKAPWENSARKKEEKEVQLSAMKTLPFHPQPPCRPHLKAAALESFFVS